MLTVSLVEFDALTDTQKMGVSHNGGGAEWAN
jgi:hypothetical protein